MASTYDGESFQTSIFLLTLHRFKLSQSRRERLSCSSGFRGLMSSNCHYASYAFSYTRFLGDNEIFDIARPGYMAYEGMGEPFESVLDEGILRSTAQLSACRSPLGILDVLNHLIDRILQRDDPYRIRIRLSEYSP